MAEARVLLVEDNRQVSRLLSLVLRDSGFAVTTANCGSTALRELRTNAFDVLVADFHLPDMNGLTLIGIGKTEFPSMQSILVSGVIDDHLRNMAIHSGAAAVVDKLNEANHLPDRIAAILGSGDRPPF